MDWLEFFGAHGIDYATQGPNVSRGNAVIACPYCGDDPSMHLSVSLSGAGWYCFRQPAHRGKSAARLVQALLGCSWQQACALAGVNVVTLPSDPVSKIRETLMPMPRQWRKHLTLPEQFRVLDQILPAGQRFIKYLQRRGIEPISRVREFDIRYCIRGAFKHRVIFPVTFDRALVTWTGRSIYPDSSRYRTLSSDPDKAAEQGYAPALGPISDYLLFWDRLRDSDADTICICEGPMDALKIWLLGESLGVVGTCFFTATASAMQIDLLHEILPRFRRRLLLLDQGTLPTALHLHSRLIALGCEIGRLPMTVKDPGELTRQQLLQVLR